MQFIDNCAAEIRAGDAGQHHACVVDIALNTVLLLIQAQYFVAELVLFVPFGHAPAHG